MKVGELKKALSLINDDNMEVVIPIFKKGILGAHPSTKVKAAGEGFDWDVGIFYLWPEINLMEKL